MEENINYFLLIGLAFLGWIAFVHLHFEIKDLRNIIKYLEKEVNKHGNR